MLTFIKKNKHEILFLSLLVVIELIMILVNFKFGFSYDLDSYAVINNAQRYLKEGYIRSRTWGFPLYEFVIYPIIFYFGLTAAKLYSLFLTLLNVVVFFTISRLILKKHLIISFFATLGFVLLPVTIVSGNTILETAQGLFLGLCSILFFINYWIQKKYKYLFLMVIFVGLATATRPDYLILGCCEAFVIVILKSIDFKKALLLSGLFLVITITPYIVVYGNWYTSLSVVIPDSMFRKIVRAFFGFIGVWGIPAFFILLSGFFLYRKKIVIEYATEQKKPLLLFFISCVIMYGIRFLFLPDELEYIIILVPITLVLILQFISSEKFFIVLAFAMFLPNIVQLHLFTRDFVSFENVVNIGISPGAVYQERRMRLLNEYMTQDLPKMELEISKTYEKANYYTEMSDEENALVIIPEERLRYYREDRLDGKYNSIFNTQTIVVYDLPSNYGWRVFMKFIDWNPLTINDFHVVTEIPDS